MFYLKNSPQLPLGMTACYCCPLSEEQRLREINSEVQCDVGHFTTPGSCLHAQEQEAGLCGASPVTWSIPDPQNQNPWGKAQESIYLTRAPSMLKSENPGIWFLTLTQICYNGLWFCFTRDFKNASFSLSLAPELTPNIPNIFFRSALYNTRSCFIK